MERRRNLSISCPESRQGIVEVEVKVTFVHSWTLSSVEAVQKNQSVLLSGSQGTCLRSLQESLQEEHFVSFANIYKNHLNQPSLPDCDSFGRSNEKNRFSRADFSHLICISPGLKREMFTLSPISISLSFSPWSSSGIVPVLYHSITRTNARTRKRFCGWRMVHLHHNLPCDSN